MMKELSDQPLSEAASGLEQLPAGNRNIVNAAYSLT